VNDRPIPLHSANADVGRWFTGTIPRDAIAVDPSHVEIVFHVSGAVTPQSLGMNQDTRQLGLLMDWVELRPRSDQELRTSVEIPFSGPVYGDGWEGPNGPGRWMTSSTSTVLVPRLQRSAFTLTLEVVGSLLPQMLDSLTCRVNGTPVALRRTDVRQTSLFRAFVPRDVIVHANDPAEVTLHIDQARTPKELGMNTDTRTLGLFVKSLSLSAVPDPPASSVTH
jgi:hypothetical protein